MSHISWFTPAFGQNHGYGVAALETIKALQRQGVKVSWNYDPAYVHINFVQPEIYQGNDNQYRIGYTPWESTSIPLSWRHGVSRMNEMWTTSRFCADIFEHEGLAESVQVFPHGIDPEVFQIVERTLTDRFIFFHMGGPTGRKGGEMVGKAFLECFDNRDDVFLLMKSHGPSEARWIDETGYHGNIGNHPRVQVIEHDLDVSDIAKLYNVAHCCVYPTNGEGFGLIPFQAIATGLPTIVTNLTATADFAHLSIPLDATWTNGDGIHEGMWALPSYDDLCHQMLKVVDNWETEKIKAVQSARIIHATQTWDHIAAKMIAHLGDKVNISLGE